MKRGPYRKSEPIETTDLCEYGCGSVAKFKNLSGKLICCQRAPTCPSNKKKNSESLLEKISSGEIDYSVRVYTDESRKRQGHNKGKSAENCPSIARAKETLRSRLDSGEYVRLGTPHTIETKKKLSEIATKRIETDPNVKWFVLANGLRVQGSWEYKVGCRLLELGYVITRPRIQYAQTRTYTPDFYIQSLDIYIEVKGWLSDRDIKKYGLVFSDNPDLNVVILEDIVGEKQYSKFLKGEIELSECNLLKDRICPGG